MYACMHVYNQASAFTDTCAADMFVRYVLITAHAHTCAADTFTVHAGIRVYVGTCAADMIAVCMSLCMCTQVCAADKFIEFFILFFSYVYNATSAADKYNIAAYIMDI